LIAPSCSEPTILNSTPDIYIAEVKAEPLTGRVVRLPKEDLNLSTPEGKAKAKKLIVDLTVSDRRNARGYNNLKKYQDKLRSIYNPTKKGVTPTS
jgi:hypothetical protein